MTFNPRLVLMRRLMPRAAVLGLIVVAAAACASVPPPTVPSATVTPTYASVPSGEWWAVGAPGVTTCGPSVTIWIHGQIEQLGGCAGRLVDAPTPLALRVGEEIGIHMTVDSSGWPHPPPSPTVEGIVQIRDQTSGPLSVFQAIRPGVTTLSSRGLHCPASDLDFNQPCAIIALTVTP